MDGKVRYLYKEKYNIYTVYTIVWLYNHDRIHRRCTCSTLRVWTEKTNIRIFMNIWGRNMWGKILECTNTAKANTIGITMFPYRKHVWNPADWHFFGIDLNHRRLRQSMLLSKTWEIVFFPDRKWIVFIFYVHVFRFRKMLLFHV